MARGSVPDFLSVAAPSPGVTEGTITFKKLTPGRVLSHISLQNENLASAPVLVHVFLYFHGEEMLLLGGWVRAAGTAPSTNTRGGGISRVLRVQIPEGGRLHVVISNNTGATQTIRCHYITEIP